MKIFLGGHGSCGVHNEKAMLERYINYGCGDNVVLTECMEEADLIVFLESCIMTEDRFRDTLNILNYFIDNKKENAEVIVSGCLANGVKFEYSEAVEELLRKTKIIPSDKIISYILRDKLGIKLDEEDELFSILPFYLGNSFIISPVSGCLNNCSFCKRKYMNFDLKSVPIEYIVKVLDWLKKNDLMVNLCLLSSNLSLYGVDLYGKQLAHEIISLCSESNNVVTLNCNALINFYPELVEEIIKNKKIYKIFSSLETGGIDLYNRMNRPIGLYEWRDIIAEIRKYRPDILIDTEIIAGFPGETVDDIRATLYLIKTLGLHVSKVHEYEDSVLIESSKYDQHSGNYKKLSKRYFDSQLTLHNRRVIDKAYLSL